MTQNERMRPARRRIHCAAWLAAVLCTTVVDGQTVHLSPRTLKMRALPVVAEACQTVARSDTLTREFPCTGWTIEATEWEGHAAAHLRIGSNYETFVDRVTMRPLFSRYVTPRDSFEVRVSGTAVSGWIAWGGQPWREVLDEIGEAFFGVAVEHLLGTFPLAAGYQAIVPMYAPYTSISRDTLRVVGVDTLPFRGINVPTWRVEIVAPRASALPRTFWVDQTTGRLLQRRNAAPGGTTVTQTVR